MKKQTEDIVFVDCFEVQPYGWMSLACSAGSQGFIPLEVEVETFLEYYKWKLLYIKERELEEKLKREEISRPIHDSEFEKYKNYLNNLYDPVMFVNFGFSDVRIDFKVDDYELLMTLPLFLNARRQRTTLNLVPDIKSLVKDVFSEEDIKNIIFDAEHYFKQGYKNDYPIIIELSSKLDSILKTTTGLESVKHVIINSIKIAQSILKDNIDKNHKLLIFPMISFDWSELVFIVLTTDLKLFDQFTTEMLESNLIETFSKESITNLNDELERSCYNHTLRHHLSDHNRFNDYELLGKEIFYVFKCDTHGKDLLPEPLRNLSRCNIIVQQKFEELKTFLDLQLDPVLFEPTTPKDTLKNNLLKISDVLLNSTPYSCSFYWHHYFDSTWLEPDMLPNMTPRCLLKDFINHKMRDKNLEIYHKKIHPVLYNDSVIGISIDDFKPWLFNNINNYIATLLCAMCDSANMKKILTHEKFDLIYAQDSGFDNQLKKSIVLSEIREYCKAIGNSLARSGFQLGFATDSALRGSEKEERNQFLSNQENSYIKKIRQLIHNWNDRENALSKFSGQRANAIIEFGVFPFKFNEILDKLREKGVEPHSVFGQKDIRIHKLKTELSEIIQFVAEMNGSNYKSFYTHSYTTLTPETPWTARKRKSSETEQDDHQKPHTLPLRFLVSQTAYKISLSKLKKFKIPKSLMQNWLSILELFNNFIQDRPQFEYIVEVLAVIDRMQLLIETFDSTSDSNIMTKDHEKICTIDEFIYRATKLIEYFKSSFNKRFDNLFPEMDEFHSTAELNGVVHTFMSVAAGIQRAMMNIYYDVWQPEKVTLRASLLTEGEDHQILLNHSIVSILSVSIKHLLAPETLDTIAHEVGHGFRHHLNLCEDDPKFSTEDSLIANFMRNEFNDFLHHKNEHEKERFEGVVFELLPDLCYLHFACENSLEKYFERLFFHVYSTNLDRRDDDMIVYSSYSKAKVWTYILRTLSIFAIVTGQLEIVLAKNSASKFMKLIDDYHKKFENSRFSPFRSIGRNGYSSTSLDLKHYIVRNELLLDFRKIFNTYSKNNRKIRLAKTITKLYGLIQKKYSSITHYWNTLNLEEKWKSQHTSTNSVTIIKSYKNNYTTLFFLNKIFSTIFEQSVFCHGPLPSLFTHIDLASGHNNAAPVAPVSSQAINEKGQCDNLVWRWHFERIPPLNEQEPQLTPSLFLHPTIGLFAISPEDRARTFLTRSTALLSLADAANKSKSQLIDARVNTQLRELFRTPHHPKGDSMTSRSPFNNHEIIKANIEESRYNSGFTGKVTTTFPPPLAEPILKSEFTRKNKSDVEYINQNWSLLNRIYKNQFVLISTEYAPERPTIFAHHSLKRVETAAAIFSRDKGEYQPTIFYFN